MKVKRGFNVSSGLKGAILGIIILCIALYKYLITGTCSGDCGNFVFVCISCQAYVTMGIITALLGFVVVGYLGEYMR